jgi:hypothetical protein
MWKSKALEMAQSGKEMLHYDACRQCVKEILYHGAYNDDEEFGQWFIGRWEQQSIPCPYIVGKPTVDPFEQAPDNCPYILEHTLAKEK